ncbi:MAG TPA: hypothetical protein VFC47_11335 [Caulobacteraceae bacterium]|nr:hypothetical protein [Caulobacteraceae bacterium]
MARVTGARLTVAHASAFDFEDALTDDGERPVAMNRPLFALFARQVSTGCAFTMRDGAGRLVMIAGLYPIEGRAEAWWAVGPAMRANLRAGLRIWLDLLLAVAQDVAPIEVRAHIAARSVAGAAMARWCGFTEAGHAEFPGFGRMAVWRRLFTPEGADGVPDTVHSPDRRNGGDRRHRPLPSP